MDPYTAFLIGSTAVSVYGQIKAGSDEAKAAQANAAFYKKQAEYNAMIAKREEDNFKRELAGVQADTVVGAASSGIALTGSILSAMADNMTVGAAEIDDIRLRGRMQVEQSQFAAERSIAEGKAARIKAFAGTTQTILGAGADYYDRQSK